MQNLQGIRKHSERASNSVRTVSGKKRAEANDLGTTVNDEESTSLDEDETSSSGSSELTEDEETSSKLEGDGKKIPLQKGEGITHPKTGNPDIHNRLASFFSQLAEQRSQPSAADEVIERGSDSDSGFEDEGDEGQQYIELDLAMGVLSEDPKGKQSDNVELPSQDDEGSEISDTDDAPLQKLTSVADAERGSSGSKSNTPKKRKIEELG